MNDSSMVEFLKSAALKGIITQADIPRVSAWARAEGVSPLDILVDEGRLSRESAETLLAECDGAVSDAGTAKSSVSSSGHGSEGLRTGPGTGDSTEQVTIRHLTGGFGSDSGAFSLIKDSIGAGMDPYMNFPRDWDRYELVKFLGEGGMGRVYHAFDPRLKRDVALKFVRGDDPDLIQRFINEAQAQARVDHKNLCHIHEIGEVGGKAYISMQLVDGDALNIAAKSMNLEQKLVVMKEVAEAVHEAHRKGLIHRDLKPSNILVERTREGGWKPVVMDFGLAREQAAPGLTATGAVVGTPHYMPPEQARGEIHKLDRRTDVYSLGATLYEILVGKPPFQGISSINILFQVLNDEPSRLRYINPDIPEDLETITLKCLEKSQSKRYESARAMAEDLGRFLDGEPIKARPVSWFYRLQKKAKKNKLAVTVAAVAFVALMISLIWGGYGIWVTKKKARLALELNQEVEQIEAVIHLYSLLPLHDIRPYRKDLSVQMEAMEKHISELGRIAKGPGHFALGRGYLALERFEEAKRHLTTAWEHGYREAEVANALGLANGHLYQQALLEADQIPDSVLREARKQEIEKLFRKPALSYLQKGQGADPESETYVKALIAFYEKHYEDALELSREVVFRFPWFYKGHQLEGDIYVTWGDDQRNRGHPGMAQTHYGRAAAAYEKAALKGTSDPTVYLAISALARSRIRMEINGGGGDIDHYFQEGIQNCTLALQADADSLEANYLKGQLLKRMGEFQFKGNADPEPYLEQAANAATRALQIDPEHADILYLLGVSFSIKARHQNKTGIDPRPSLRKARDALLRADRLLPSYKVSNSMGVSFRVHADYVLRVGGDPVPLWEEALEWYAKALRINPEFFGVYNNMSGIYHDRAHYLIGHGKQPQEDLDKAIDLLERGLRINSNPIMRYQLGRIFHIRGDYVKRYGMDPSSDFNRALSFFREAVELSPDSNYRSYFYAGMGDVYFGLADYQWEQGGDPANFLQKSVTACRQSLGINPKEINALLVLGNTYTQWGKYELAAGHDPGKVLANARNYFSRLLYINPKDLQGLEGQADTFLTQIEHELDRGSSPEKSFGQIVEVIRKSLELNATSYIVLSLKAKMHLLEARWRMRTGKNPEVMFKLGFEANHKAMASNSHERSVLLVQAMLHFWVAHYRIGQGEEASENIDKGKAMIEKLLDSNNRNGLALGLKMGFYMLAAQLLPDPAERERMFASSKKIRGQAVFGNANLTLWLTNLEKKTLRP